MMDIIEKLRRGWTDPLATPLEFAEAADEIESLRARLWNYEHGTAGMCASAAIGAATEWEKEVEVLHEKVETLTDRLQLNDMENAALRKKVAELEGTLRVARDVGNTLRDQDEKRIAYLGGQLAALRKRIDEAPVVAHAVMNGDRVLQLSVSCDPFFPNSTRLISKEDLQK